MKAGNAKLLAASAVVVALVLVFSYVTLGGEDGDDRIRTDKALGDRIEFLEARDGVEYKHEVVLVGSTGEDDIISFDGRYVTVPSDYFLNIVLQYDGVPVGTEVIDTFRGKLECTIYYHEGPHSSGFSDLRFWVHDGVTYKETSSSGYAVFLGTTLFDDAPEFPEPPAVSDVAVGDWMEVAYTYHGGELPDVTETVRETVVAVDGDVLTVEDGSGNAYRVTVSEFLTSVSDQKVTETGEVLIRHHGEAYPVTILTSPGEDGGTITLLIGGGLCYGWATFDADGRLTVSASLTDTSLV